MTTPHINAPNRAFADVVLMPGDPLRAEFIAVNFLEQVERVSDVRNVWGYTGRYQDQPISVMAHGMGIPSASIYTHELISEYGVRRIIRVGSCGTFLSQVKLHDVLIATSASTDSAVNRSRFEGYDLAATASFRLVEAAVIAARKSDVRFHVGSIFSTDLFYPPDERIGQLSRRFNLLGIEMEAAGIYPIAAELGAEALVLATVCDELTTGRKLTSEERQSSFHSMIRIALEVAVGTNSGNDAEDR